MHWTNRNKTKQNDAQTISVFFSCNILIVCFSWHRTLCSHTSNSHQWHSIRIVLCIFIKSTWLFCCRKISWMHNWDSIFLLDWKCTWTQVHCMHFNLISSCLTFFSSMKFEFEDYFGIELVKAFSIMFLICRLFSFCFFYLILLIIFSLCFYTHASSHVFSHFPPFLILFFFSFFSNFVFFSSNI